jgi:Immunity protein 49
MRIREDGLAVLEDEIGFCLENIRHPRCRLEMAGRFYEDAAEALRAHGILRLLVDAERDGFSTSLVMSGHARRAFLRRCARQRYADCFLAFSRSGSMLDAIAADDLTLAAEIFSLSAATLRRGDEYEDDFRWQRFLGVLLTGAPSSELDAALAALDAASEGSGARLALAKALRARDAAAFDEAFRALLAERSALNEEDAARSAEEVTVAAGALVFVEGIAVLKLARRSGIAVAHEYPMCPTLALLPAEPATPPDEFSPP